MPFPKTEVDQGPWLVVAEIEPSAWLNDPAPASTLAPASRASIAAQAPAMPNPTTTISASSVQAGTSVTWSSVGFS